MSVTRTDRADTPLGPPRTLEDGRVVYEGIIARPGIYEYRENGGITRELVPAETLSDPAWLDSLRGITVVVEHPTDAAGESVAVGPQNFRSLAVGTVIGVRIGPGGVVIGEIVVTAQEGHDAIRAGKIGLSPRYLPTIDTRPGVHPVYGAFDTVQTARRAADQVALCDCPRGGTTIIRRDSVTGDVMDMQEALKAAGVPEDKVADLAAAIEKLIMAAKGEGSAEVEVEVESSSAAADEGAAEGAAAPALEERLSALEEMVKGLVAAVDAMKAADASRADSAATLTGRLGTVEESVKGIKADVLALHTATDKARADADRAELAEVAARLRVDSADSWSALARAAGAEVEGLTEEAAREVARVAARKSSDPRWDSLRGADHNPAPADFPII